MPNSFQAFLDEAQAAASTEARQQLVDNLLNEREDWPWIEGNQATFIYAEHDAQQVALNLDTISGDPPFAPMTRLEGTNLFYVTRDFAPDDLLDYLLAVNDPMTPLAQETDIAGRATKYWRADPKNPLVMRTPQMDVSVLRMGAARPFPDWVSLADVPRGKLTEHRINSQQLGASGRKLWIHTPPNYDDSGLVYPLLVLQDGQWMVGPLQVPALADALVKHGRLAPVVIAMIQSGTQQDRIRDYVNNDKYYNFVLSELLPFIQSNYRVDSTNLVIGGVSAGAIAAADAALRNPAVFQGLLMISPPLGKGPAQEKLRQYTARFQEARLLPKRIFQSVGRYESVSRFVRPGHELADALTGRDDVEYKFIEFGSGHGLVGFRSIFPEALAWALPGWASL